MKIKKTIELEIIKKGKFIICNDLPTLCLICGSKAVSGNLHCYGVTKKGTEYYIGVQTLKERIKTLEQRKNNIEASLVIMRQVVKS